MTVLMRRTSGRESSAERCPFADFGEGHTSKLGRRDSCVNETTEELDEDVEYIDSFDDLSSEKDAVSGKSVKMDACRRAAFAFGFVF